jgi:geranylgeranyl diphosphate synthase type II
VNGPLPSPRSPIPSAHFDAYLAERRALVDEFMDTVVPPEETAPETISRAVRYSLFAGGKRLRPILVLASAEAVGGRVGDALPAAAAFELIHTYSLIHDDLPSMDDDSLRRGKPTSHVVFGEAIAILAGDALQTHAFRVLAEGDSPVAADRRLRAVAVLADAAGAAGMVGGQVADLEAERRPVDAEALEFIHRHKTGALIRAACEAGAIVGGAADDEVARLARYGESIGLAFQIVDDILDVTGSAASLGKTAGKDERAGKATYPGVHGIDRAHERASELVAAAVDELAPLEGRAEPLARLAQRILERSS